MIKVDSLQKRFKQNTVLNDVNITFERNKFYAILGANGSGKTTLLRILMGILTPDVGQIFYENEKVKNFKNFTSKIGYLPEGMLLYQDLSPCEFLKLCLEIKMINQKSWQVHFDYVVNVCRLEGFLYKKIGTLSKGQKRRTALAQALLGDPEILILDEPTDGLDPLQKLEIINLLKSYENKKTILLSTHMFFEVKQICSEAIILAKGELVYRGSFSQLKDEDGLIQYIKSEFSNATNNSNF